MNKFFRSIVDFFKAITAPIRSLFSGKHDHHKVTSNLNTPTPAEQAEIDKNLPKKQQCRNVYLSDLDDTLIDWEKHKQSKWDKFKHRAVFRPHDEKILHHEGSKEFIQKLNGDGVRTAIVSNKDHHKLIKQAKHHRWDILFEHILGHDRGNAFTMHKPNDMTVLPTADLPMHALEKLLGKAALHNSKEPIKVVFVGDKPDQDIAVAHLLDKALKKINPASSCTGILLKNKTHNEEQLNKLPHHHKPNHIAHNYADIERFTYEAFAIGKTQAFSQRQSTTEETPQKSQVQGLAERDASRQSSSAGVSNIIR